MDNKTKELFWNASIEEVKNGYVENDSSYTCIVCEEQFEKGRIYEINEELYDGKKTAQLHIEKRHNSMLDYLINMNPSFTGISEVQSDLIQLMAQGLSDKEISEKLGVAHSTIRNHRYKLREKEKQAKLFLAMMDLLAKNTNKKINKLDKEMICDAHKTATTLDDRYNTTDKEKQTVIETYMDESGALKAYPSKEKKKIIILEEIVKNFSKGKTYSEKEINRTLKRVFEDYATIRRALIEYGFIERTNDCSSYWIKE
jgi:Uncharacterized protein conserved in bacteria